MSKDNGQSAPVLCHRMFVPLPLMEEAVNPLQPSQKVVKSVSQITLFACKAEQCALYDKDAKRCGDLTVAIEARRANNLRELLNEQLEKTNRTMEVQ